MLTANGLRWVFSGFSLLALAMFAGMAQAADDKVEIPDPEDIDFESKDGVHLHATFYPGILKKKAIPFLMVHGWDGNRGQLDKLAKELQKRGNAILTLDLRGFGESVHYKGDNTKKIDATKFTVKDIDAMMLDLEAGKKFLMERNNAGELNIDALCVVAAQEGAIPAIKWTVLDWSAPVLPAFKQGQDVKGLILLSPILAYKGANAQQALTYPALQKNVAFLVCVGKKDPKSLQEAKRIPTAIEKFRPKGEESGLHFETLETNLQGTRLVTTPGLDTLTKTLVFVKTWLVDKQDTFEWRDRKRP